MASRRVGPFADAGAGGFMAEVGWGGLKIDDVTTTATYQITKPSFWGHRPIITR